MSGLVEEGRAKVNLTLLVMGRRSDGYHDLESVVAFADCADRLTLTPGPELDLTTAGPLAQACGEIPDNLVIKAARLLGERVPDLKVGSFTLETLKLPKMPCVMVNPCVPVATKDVFGALGLRNGELLVGAADILLQDRSWPKEQASLEDWVEALAASSNDLEVPAMRIEPVIGEVIAALSATNGAWLARMSGSGATCFAIYENTAEAQRAAEKIRRDRPVWWVHAGTLS